MKRAPIDVDGVLGQPEHLALTRTASGADIDHRLIPLRKSRSNGEHLSGHPRDN
ncbi:hypothetical protein ABZV67_03105 [Streptomyces sp. NPDC005065]|uniref:hypothetical protein n=1 Tax=Streptomyces sp. NPDC005065 TaxID=3154461 RepID=UPI0033BA8EF0